MVVRYQQLSIPRKEKQPHVFNVTKKQTKKGNLTLLSFRIRLPWLSVEFCIRIIPVGLPVGEVFTIWKQNSTNVKTNILQRTTPKDTDAAMCAVLDDPWLLKKPNWSKIHPGLNLWASRKAGGRMR